MTDIRYKNNMYVDENAMLPNDIQMRNYRNSPRNHDVIVNNDHKGSINYELNGTEHETLLEPVQLSPGWEGDQTRTSDELDFKRPHEREREPKDSWNIVYFIMMLNGIGVLMPWNMFITAEPYFTDYKFASQNGSQDSEYKNNFISYLGIASQVPNVALNLVNLFVQFGSGSSTGRVVWSIIVMVLVFVATIILAMMDTTGWPDIFFVLTMVSVVIINMATGVYQNTIFGIAAMFPMRFTNAVVLGSNISGTLTSIIAIISLIMSPNPRTAAIYYFLAAILILLIDFDAYFALPLTRFYRFYKQKAHLSKLEAERVEPKSSGCGTYLRKYCRAFTRSYGQMYNVWFTFFVTLVCFPALMVNVDRSDPEFIIPDLFYKSVTCFLVFNVFAVVGNLITEFLKKPGPRWLWVIVTLRVVFIPLFMICNYKSDVRTVPVYIPYDWAYIAIGFMMSLSHGYCSSLSMMYAPRNAPAELAGTTGMMAAFFLVFGICSGVWFSLACAKLIETQW